MNMYFLVYKTKKLIIFKFQLSSQIIWVVNQSRQVSSPSTFKSLLNRGKQVLNTTPKSLKGISKLQPIK